ncbi:MAG: hypothetical protein IJA36_03260 [Lachnospiraceae bacterium]|nr:hypothetical protein [Lachnospiraceae bacterium]
MVSSRERIKAFDKKLLKSGEYSVILSRLPAYIFELLLIVIATSGDKLSEMDVFIVMYAWGLTFYIAPYLNIWENRKNVSIYEVLKSLPVNQWDIFKVRVEYIAKLLLSRFLIMLGLQIPGFMMTGKILKENMINSLAAIGWAALVLTIYALPGISNYRSNKQIKWKAKQGGIMWKKM